MNRKNAYFLGLTGITGLLLVIYFLLSDKLPFQAFLIVVAFYFITGISHFILVKSITSQPTKFQTYFLGAMAFKMFAYLVFLALVHFVVSPINLSFVLCFFVCYVVYTAYEMLYLRTINKKSK